MCLCLAVAAGWAPWLPRQVDMQDNEDGEFMWRRNAVKAEQRKLSASWYQTHSSAPDSQPARAASQLRNMTTRSFFEEQRQNNLRTVFFLALGIAWVFAMGYWGTVAQFLIVSVAFGAFSSAPPDWLAHDMPFVWGFVGGTAALCLWIVTATVSYYRAATIGPRLIGAARASGADACRLHGLRESLLTASLVTPPGPDLYVWETEDANAFAIGRSPERGSIVLTRGLLDALTDEELRTVLGHELAHLKNRDTVPIVQAMAFVSTLAVLGMWGLANTALALGLGYAAVRVCIAAIRGIAETESSGEYDGLMKLAFILGGVMLLFSAIAYGIALALTCAIIFGVVILVVGVGIRYAASAISASREYLADACATQWTRKPEALASALAKLSAAPESAVPGSTAGLLLKPLMFNASSAIRGWRRFADAIMSTHPPAHYRIASLEEMKGLAIATSGGYSIPARLLRTRWLEWLAPGIISAVLLLLMLIPIPWHLTPTLIERLCR